ncbi:pentapeptide repeat-containing protein [Anaerotruncus sp. AF02-27]|nr:pentapeptide repeat-containing protein [Anaerotruncus sp. AF02-27]
MLLIIRVTAPRFSARGYTPGDTSISCYFTPNRPFCQFASAALPAFPPLARTRGSCYNFRCTTIGGVCMKITPPQLPAAREETSELFALCAAAYADGEDVKARIFKALVISGETADPVSFHGVSFENCRLTGCSFRKCDFIDVEFCSCDLSNSDFEDCYFKRCTFTGCKAVGANIQNASLLEIILDGVNFRYANFDRAKIKQARFAESDLRFCSFSECKISALELSQSVLSGANFFKTPLRGVDFTKSEIDGLVLAGEELKGAIVTSPQAADLAKLLGLIVRD